MLPQQFKGQIIATTHSLECARAAHEAFRGGRDFALHRLERIDGDVKVFTYDRETLEAALEADLEVR